MTDNSLKMLFNQHIKQLQKNITSLLESSCSKGIWIHAGQAENYFLDDQHKPFRANPLFNYFVPSSSSEGSWIYTDGINKPKLFFYQPNDYWHFHQMPEGEFWQDEFDWTILKSLRDIEQHLNSLDEVIYLGEHDEMAKALGFESINPQKALNYLHYQRSFKSEYEQHCLRQAQRIAVKGHESVKQAFMQGEGSEFLLNLNYLKASQQSDLEVPYGNIIAINQHASTLHYTHRDIVSPTQLNSLLIDAGANYHHYAADITRTYAFDQQSEFAEMIHFIDEIKRKVIESMQLGFNFLTYHTITHQYIAEFLQRFDIVKMDEQDIFENGISRTFFPHGLGHMLGLQVHDVAGLQHNMRGSRKQPPSVYPSLRCLRNLEENMVLTIEPGCYFIPMLMKSWRNHSLGQYFNWHKIGQLIEFGGIRSEDNIIIHQDKIENITLNTELELTRNERVEAKAIA